MFGFISDRGTIKLTLSANPFSSEISVQKPIPSKVILNPRRAGKPLTESTENDPTLPDDGAMLTMGSFMSLTAGAMSRNGASASFPLSVFT